MANINDLYPSKFLKASDLQGRSYKVIIDRTAVEKVGQDQKLVVYFKGKQKGMVCNKSNAMMIAGVYSPQTDGWVGKEIKIYPGKTQFNGQVVDTLKVEVIPAETGADFKDDEIPDFGGREPGEEA